jgi:hypothetical protein
MQQKIFLTLLFIGIFITIAYSRITTTKPVVQEVYDYLGNYPENVLYPEEGSIKFKAWIAERPEYILTDDHPSCYADTHSNHFTIRFNLESFSSIAGSPVGWKPGERVRIEVFQTSTGFTAETEFEIGTSNAPIIRLNEEAISLKRQQRLFPKDIPETEISE